MALAVDIRHLSFAYPAADDRMPASWAVHDVSLQVEEGGFCLIVGATGSGKTTLLRCLKPELVPVGQHCGAAFVLGAPVLVSNVPDASYAPNTLTAPVLASDAPVSVPDAPVAPGASEGSQPAALDAPRVAGLSVEPVTTTKRPPLSPVESAEQIGFVMQDPQVQITCDSVWHELAFGLENLGYDQDVMRRRIAEVAHFFGIEPWVRRSTQELSGGQAQIVNLAAVLALRPRLILLDEPTAQLDPNARDLFVSLLTRVNRELGITVVVATHAPEDFADAATSVFEMSPLCPVASRDEALRPLARTSGEGVDAAGEDQREGEGRRGEGQRGENQREVRHRDSRTPARGEEACLTLTDVYFRYERDGAWVLRGIDLSLTRGGIHALVGGNGCGKTTLMRVIAGVLSVQRGRVRNRSAKSQALLPQDPKALFVCDSVIEELDEWAKRCGYGRSEELACARRFGLDGADMLARHPYDLSGGQQQKLALAKLLLTNPDLLLLDEPTKGLDAQATAEIVRILRTLADEGRTVVVVTHDLDFASLVADTVTMLFDGEVAASQPVGQFFSDNLIYRPHERARLYGALR